LIVDAPMVGALAFTGDVAAISSMHRRGQGSPPYLREPRHRDDVIGGTPMSGRPRRCLVSTLEKQT
jgi:hypothetical protein